VPTSMSKPSDLSDGFKNKNNLELVRRPVSEIKLKRTDTTLDLSQKAKRAAEQTKGRRKASLYRLWKALKDASVLALHRALPGQR